MVVTREQVAQWADQANGIQVRGAHPGMTGFYPQALIDFATLARADLEATIEEQAKEIDRLQKYIAQRKWEFENIELSQQLTDQAKEIEQLKISAANDRKVYVLADNQLRRELAASQAREAQLRDALVYERSLYFEAGSDIKEQSLELLLQPFDDSALREYGAKLVERVAAGNDLSTSLYLKAIARKIREGAF